MNYYIIFTQDIHEVGGMQLYSAGKTEYYSRQGWKTVIFHPGYSPKNDCAYKQLNEYVKYSFPFLEIPPVAFNNKELAVLLNKMIKTVGCTRNDVVYVESQYDVAALWAELLGERLGAKHICFNCNEIFKGGYKLYEYLYRFFWFKYKRKELLGLRPDTVCKIFEGFKDVEPDESIFFDAVEPEPIQNVYDARVNQIKEADYTIMYLGRIVKGYVPNIIDGVVRFAQKYNDKQIQFVIIGDISDRKKELFDAIEGINNLRLVPLGNMVPIPKEIYSHIDVVIAGAVCAEASARCGVPTIVADCENYLANGVLGYTVHNSMYSEEQTEQTDFCVAIEDTLIYEKYKNYDYSFAPAPDTDGIYESHLRYFDDNKELEYFDISEIDIPVNYSKMRILEYVRYLLFKVKRIYGK